MEKINSLLLVLALSLMGINPSIAQVVDTLNVEASVDVPVDTLGVNAGTEAESEYDMRVAAILPFFTQLVVDTVGPPPRREWKMREIAMEYVNGLRWAAKRLSDAGYDVELSLYDEVPDSLGESLWGTEDLMGVDVVMGPMQQSVLSRNLRVVEKSGAEHILITKVNPHIVQTGEHVRSSLPDPSRFVDLIVDKVVSDHVNDNVIFVMAGGADTRIEQEFLEKYPVAPAAYDSLKVDSLRFDTVMGTKHSIGSLAEKIQFYERNVIISLASRRSKSMLSSLQSAVQVNDSTEIFVYAGSELMDWGFIDLAFLERTRTTIPRSGVIDWSDSTVVDAVLVYRNHYDTEPSKYAIRAHDALLDAFVRKMGEMPIDSTLLATDSLATWDLSTLPKPIATDFNWSQLGEEGEGGFVNSTWELSTFHLGKWCDTDTVPGLAPFIEPELDEEGFYIRP